MRVPQWDQQVLRKCHRWAGHVGRFGAEQPDRLAWECLAWRGMRELTARKAANQGLLGTGHYYFKWRREEPLYNWHSGWEMLNRPGVGPQWDSMEDDWVCFRALGCHIHPFLDSRVPLHAW